MGIHSNNKRIVAGLLLAMTVLAPAALADVGMDNPLAVFITYPEGTYVVGATFDADIWVYNQSVAYDPYNVSFSTGFFGMGRQLPVDRVGAGHYTTSFTIEEADLFLGVLVINAVATEGPDIMAPTATAMSFVLLASFDVMVEQSGSLQDNHPHPGQTVYFNVTYDYLGSPVDPDDGTAEADVMDSSGATTPLPLTRVSTGRFSGDYTIPADLAVGQEFFIEGRGSLTTASGTIDGSSTTGFSVELFSVWMHVGSASPAGITVDVFGMSESGTTITGAPISVTFFFTDSVGDEVSSTQTGTIDGTGKATLTDGLSDVAVDETTVDLNGQVDWAGESQKFSGTVMIRDPSAQPIPDSGMYVAQEYPNILRLGETATLHQVAYYDGSVLPLQDIYVYVVGEREVLYNGKVTTDAQGRFSFTVTAPTTVGQLLPLAMMTTYYQAEIGGLWEATSNDLFAGDISLMDLLGPVNPGTSIAVQPFELGGTVDVTLTDAEAAAADEAMVTWGIGDMAPWDNLMDGYAPNWSAWTGTDIPYLRMVPCTWSGGAFHATFPFPDFIPVGEAVFFIGTISVGGELHAATAEGLHALVPSHTPPTVDISYPAEGGTYHGSVVVSGESAAGSSPVQAVEVRIDGGSWVNATGTTGWYYALDTTTLAKGAHTVEARSFDGEAYSNIALVSFTVDQLPTVTILVPQPGATYGGVLLASGTAADDGTVANVSVKVDDGPEVNATGTTSWTYSIDTTALARGAHTLTATSYDGSQASAQATAGFTVDQPPTVVITMPVSGVSYNGTLTATGTADDDGTIVRVEVNIDGGAWVAATGTATWSYGIDTTTLGFGAHALSARSYDGVSYSPVASVSFDVDQPPIAAITAPTQGQLVSGYINVTGTATDDEAITRVEVRIDGGDWEEATGTATWTFEVDTTLLAFGAHQVDVQSFDGALYSALASVGITVDQPPVVSSVVLPGQFLGGTVAINGTASDDSAVTGVEYNIDNGAWATATGTSTWTFTMDTTKLAFGGHALYVRCYDGHSYSAASSKTFSVDQPPTITVTTPVQDAKYSKAFDMTGASSDDGTIATVEYRVDGGEWISVTGTTTWSAKLDASKLSKGSHTIEFRSFDGRSYSPMASRTITVTKAAKSPGMGAPLVVIGLAAAALVLLRRRV